MAQNIKIGTYTGTGAAIDVQVGFDVDYVRIWNVTDGDETYEWFTGMTNAHALKATNNASTQFSRITSNGVSLYAGTATAAKGFTVGTAISESAKVFAYIAVQNGE